MTLPPQPSANHTAADMRGRILLLAASHDSDFDALDAAWQAAGGIVRRLQRFWEPPPLDPERVAVYGAQTFCLVLRQRLGLQLVEPPSDYLADLAPRWTRRQVDLLSLGDALRLEFPRFVKPAMSKFFTPGVYATADDLRAECDHLPEDTMTLVADVVAFRSEVRVFSHGGQVLDLAAYRGTPDLAGARAFLAELFAAAPVPSPCVLDIGEVVEHAGNPGGWALVDASAAWGASLNGCDATRLLPAIAAATLPASDG